MQYIEERSANISTVCGQHGGHLWQCYYRRHESACYQISCVHASATELTLSGAEVGSVTQQ